MTETLAQALGDFATTIGLSRPAGQCFAAIWRAPQPPSADDLVTTLALSRSNISTALKELRGWGLVTARRGAGERRDSYTAPTDPRDLMRLILAARRQMILAPFAERLLGIETTGDDARAAALHDLALTVDAWLSRLSRMEPAAFDRAIGQAGDPGKHKKKKKKKGV